MDAMHSLLEGLIRQVRLADIGDILLVSVVVYGLLVWLRRAVSPAVQIAALALVGVYAAARAFDMYLITMIFHGVFTVLLIALVILFQEDVRRVLQRRPRWSSWRTRSDSENLATDVDCLVEAVFHLAAKRMGVLIVLRGREPLDPHIEGGVALRGQLSQPLLYSLFDSHSPGHDGAVLVEERLITRFGAHLPLSRNPLAVGSLGTRHSAALGLSERTDALVVVVSEEDGTVRVVEDGVLQVVESPAALKDRVEQFSAARFLEASSSSWMSALTSRLPYKLLALGLAVSAWLLFAYRPDTIERTFHAPIEYRNVPENVVLGPAAPSEARVTLSGRDRAFALLDPESLRVSLDLRLAGPGLHEFPLTARHVNVPTDLDVAQIQPRVIRVRLMRTPAGV